MNNVHWIKSTTQTEFPPRTPVEWILRANYNMAGMVVMSLHWYLVWLRKIMGVSR